MSPFLAGSANPYVPMRRHFYLVETPTTESIWFNDEETTSIFIEFFQNKARHPNRLAYGVTQ